MTKTWTALILFLFSMGGCASNSGRPQLWIDHIDPRAEQHVDLTWVSYAEDGVTTRGLSMVHADYRSWLAAPTMEAGPNGAKMNINTDNPTTVWSKVVEVLKGLAVYVAGHKQVIAVP